MGASLELEKIATSYASEAVQLDRQGRLKDAILMYNRASEVLTKLVQLCPNYGLNNIYLQRAAAYRDRVKELQRIESVEHLKREASSIGTPSTSVDLDNLLIRERLSVRWEDVVGLEHAKKVIRQAIIYPSLRPDLFPLGWARGILLFGPPGCGKTLLAAAVATEIDATFISVDAASIMSKWLGESEANVARLFASARKAAERGRPVILFIDELDSLMGMRSHEVGGEARARNQFLAEMDGIIDKSKRFHLYVIGATNAPWQLSWPILRRFQYRILIPMPDFNARIQMFKLYTRGVELAPDVNFEELARMTEGFSGSDIRDVCQSTHLNVIGEIFESGRANDKSAKPRPIRIEDFREVLRTRRPSITPEMVASYQKWADTFKAL